MLYRGPDRPKVLVIAEAPGEEEVRRQKPLVGRAGQVFWSLVSRCLEDTDLIDLSLEEIGATNVIACFPEAELGSRSPFRQPTDAEAAACRDRLVDTLQKTQPSALWVSGKVARRLAPPALKAAFGRERPPVLHISHPSFWARSGGIDSVPAQEARFQIVEFLIEQFPLANLPRPAQASPCPRRKPVGLGLPRRRSTKRSGTRTGG